MATAILTVDMVDTADTEVSADLVVMDTVTDIVLTDTAASSDDSFIFFCTYAGLKCNTQMVSKSPVALRQ